LLYSKKNKDYYKNESVREKDFIWPKKHTSHSRQQKMKEYGKEWERRKKTCERSVEENKQT